MTKNQDSMPSHTMELPRQIVVGEGNINEIGNFFKGLDKPRKVSLISGSNVRKVVQKKIERSLESAKIRYAWHVANSNEISNLKILQKEVKQDKSSLIVGIGGGRAVDAAKMVGFDLKKPFVSVPTAASHDGIASPFVSIKGDKPHSIVATAPLGVFVDIEIIKSAPKRLLASGCGDLIANIIAVKDWKLGRDKTGEYYGRYAADLALMSANIVMENSSTFAKNGVDVRVIVEALISAGVASCIAGSSRPCSGAEHLFSHALDKLAPGVGLHGEKCGIGSIMMAKLQGQDWKNIAQTLKNVGAPTTAKQIGLDEDVLAEAIVIAQDLRPERYTILKEKSMTKKKAISLAKSTNVI
ncbi:NAD(P)-dependent glycerol-1-phosphate dehydrogenase [Nitrosopumilus sp. b1]|uniref:NAD(P)-dependent glycerol-1-phosphate dehydrogenase n=1 Tax=Nitrosopumilus sp. b1 TaxID=2109907 RepID=UPI0015F48033|nr:NAD(P)-dependent glycerol-1-phosphate dehydrogenase [Nitrosopumilus sp. b1]KAF6243058.1 NAD(P)-dependent glycerol-1-phosphate dehydrogenase [Nitrosopumilus sp. b1]